MWSGERGPIYLGNISNCVKQAPGVRRFQVVQKAADQVLVKLVVDPAIHNIAERETLLREFVDRLGAKVSVAFQYVDDIPREPNGKYRIVKNLLTSPRD
jgi:phenylacetate-CoA ligase